MRERARSIKRKTRTRTHICIYVSQSLFGARGLYNVHHYVCSLYTALPFPYSVVRSHFLLAVCVCMWMMTLIAAWWRYHVHRHSLLTSSIVSSIFIAITCKSQKRLTSLNWNALLNTPKHTHSAFFLQSLSISWFRCALDFETGQTGDNGVQRLNINVSLKNVFIKWTLIYQQRSIYVFRVQWR